MFRWVPRWLRVVFAVTIVAVVARYVVAPRIADVQSSVDVITRVDLLFLVVGAVAGLAPIACQAELTRVALPAKHQPGRVGMIRIELAATAVSHTVPGGTAAGTALAYRLLRGSEVPAAESGFALAVRGIGSAAVLNVLLGLALIVSIPVRGVHPLYSTAAALGGAVLITVAVAAALTIKHQERVEAALRRFGRWVPFLEAESLSRALDGVASQLRRILRDRRMASKAVAWSASYWLISAASLSVLVTAFGGGVDLISLFVAFGVANVLAAIPVTPRGLGVVEGVLIPMLVAFGATGDAATLAVIGWRLVSFWIPIPLGAASYVSIRLAHPVAGKPSWESLAELADQARDDAEKLSSWAVRHGLTSSRR